MSWFIQTCTSSLGKKYIMATTGLMLGGFLLVHAIGNSSIFMGRDAFISYAHHLHSLGPMVTVAEFLLFSIFLLHIITGISLFLQNRNARADRYAVSTPAGGRTWGSKTMPYTGAAILCFMLLHLFNVRFLEHAVSVADTVSAVLNSPFYTLLYSAGMTVLALHISHGFWSLFQTLGINHPRYDNFIKIGGYLTSGLIIGVYLAIIFLLLCASGYLT